MSTAALYNIPGISGCCSARPTTRYTPYFFACFPNSSVDGPGIFSAYFINCLPNFLSLSFIYPVLDNSGKTIKSELSSFFAFAIELFI